MSSVSFLEKLLDGARVEWKAVGDVVSLQRGKRLVKSQLEETGNYAVYQNSMTPLGYYHESNVKFGTAFIISAGAAGEVGYSEVNFWAADDVYFFLTSDGIHDKFLYHFLLTQKNEISSQVRRASIPRLSKVVVEKIKIPIPCPENPKKSLEIQAEIVRILDAFTSLTASLTAELTSRKKQYNYYRDELLCFEEGQIEWKTLGNIYQFSSGLSKSADQFGYGSPFLSYKAVFKNISLPSDLTDLVNTSAIEQERYSIRKGDVFVTRTSECLDELGMSCAALEDYPMATFNGFTKRLRPKDPSQINPKFSAFFFRSTLFREQIARIAVLSTRVSLNDSILANIKMPVPSLAEQVRIVAILDKFDALTNSITEGLPREIELRQKQYEYYRDLLLSFPKPEVPTPTAA